MTWIDNATVAHLRDVAEWPDPGERYEVRSRLGRGGMGVVYQAFDRVLRRDVAIKVLDDLPRAADAERLMREARILAQLEHPGIVPVHDAGTVPDGRVFYVMKLVRGERLDAAVQTRSLIERLELFLRICDAVAFAHARGIVHRDLKPANIMLGTFGEVLVMDFGLASAGAFGPHESGTTEVVPSESGRVEVGTTKSVASKRWDGEISGTPGYMAPEQQRGATDVDHRADIYALGIILQALITEPAPKPLVAIADRARATEVSARYVSVRDLARDVVRFREGEPVTAYTESVFERVGRVYRRYQLPLLLVLAYIVMRMMLLAWRGV